MNRDRRLYESVNHSMMANFVDDGFKDEEVQVNESNNKGPTGFSALKYVQPTDVTPGYSTVSDADIVVLRYAHVLLMIAEAENEAHGATTTALNAINEVRTRSGQPAIEAGISQDDLRERIRNERYWELLGEDLIYFDELRWKTWKDKKFATYDDNGKQVVNGLRQVWGQATYHYAWGGDHYWLYPIPYNETQMNPNMEQNPGWK